MFVETIYQNNPEACRQNVLQKCQRQRRELSPAHFQDGNTVDQVPEGRVLQGLTVPFPVPSASFTCTGPHTSQRSGSLPDS